MRPRDVQAGPAGPLCLLRLPEVRRRTGLSRSEIYRRMAAGTFPCSVPLAIRSVGWIEHEIAGWLQDRIAARGRKIPA